MLKLLSRVLAASPDAAVIYTVSIIPLAFVAMLIIRFIVARLEKTYFGKWWINGLAYDRFCPVMLLSFCFAVSVIPFMLILSIPAPAPRAPSVSQCSQYIANIDGLDKLDADDRPVSSHPKQRLGEFAWILAILIAAAVYWFAFICLIAILTCICSFIAQCRWRFQDTEVPRLAAPK